MGLYTELCSCHFMTLITSAPLNPDFGWSGIAWCPFGVGAGGEEGEVDKDVGTPSFLAAFTQTWVSPFSSLCGPDLHSAVGNSEEDRTQPVPWSEEPKLGGG